MKRTVKGDTISLKYIVPDSICFHDEQVFEQSAQKKDTIANRICAFIQENETITMQEIANRLGLSRFAVARKIKQLKERGRIHRIGPDKGGKWRVNANMDIDV